VVSGCWDYSWDHLPSSLRRLPFVFPKTCALASAACNIREAGLAPASLSYKGLRSGRAMARSGLRMMPSFPSPSLECRTAVFPSTATRPVCQTGPSPATHKAVSRGLRPSFVLSAVIVVTFPRPLGRAAGPSARKQASPLPWAVPLPSTRGA